MRLRLAALATGLVLVVLAVVLLTGGGGDEDDAATLRKGLPDAGFPLRGDLAGDTDLQAEAVDAWQRRAQRDGGSWAGEGEDVHVLWAGKLDGVAGVVASAGGEAAFLTRRDRDADAEDPYWRVVTAPVREPAPGVVAFGGAVLVPQDAPAEFHQAQAEGDGSPAVQEDVDGLWTRGDTALPAGALVLPGGVRLPGTTEASGPVAVFTGEAPAVRELSPVLAAELTEGDASQVGAPAQRLLAAVRSAPPEGRGGATLEIPRIDLVARTTVDPLGEVLVLATSTAAAGPGPFLSAGAGPGSVAGEDLAPGIALAGKAQPFGRADDSPVLGAAYVRVGEGPPVLLVAGDDEVAGVEVRVARQRLALDVPVGAVPAPWLDVTDGGAQRLSSDVVVSGRTAAGAVVVPDVATDVQPLG